MSRRTGAARPRVAPGPWRHLVASLLEQGRLVRPLAEHVVTDHPIYIVASRTRHMQPSVATLRDWLLAESCDERT